MVVLEIAGAQPGGGGVVTNKRSIRKDDEMSYLVSVQQYVLLSFLYFLLKTWSQERRSV